MSELDMLKKQLDKIEAKLDKCRASVIEDGWQTQRFAKKSRNWDYCAQQKNRLRELIDNLEQSNEQAPPNSLAKRKAAD